MYSIVCKDVQYMTCDHDRRDRMIMMMMMLCISFFFFFSLSVSSDFFLSPDKHDLSQVSQAK